MDAKVGQNLLDRIRILEEKSGKPQPELRGQVAELILQGDASKATDKVLEAFQSFFTKGEIGGRSLKDFSDEEILECLRNPEGRSSVIFDPGDFGSSSRTSEVVSQEPRYNSIGQVSDELLLHWLRHPE